MAGVSSVGTGPNHCIYSLFPGLAIHQPGPGLTTISYAFIFIVRYVGVVAGKPGCSTIKVYTRATPIHTTGCEEPLPLNMAARGKEWR